MQPTVHHWRALVLGLAVFIGATLSVAGYSMWRLREEAITNELAMAAQHSRSFEDFLTQSLRVTELAAANAISSAELNVKSPGLRNILMSTLRHAPHIRSLSLLDDGGRIVASTNPANVGITVSTDSYLPPGAKSTDLLRIGSPWMGRDFADGRPTASGEVSAGDALAFVPMTQRLIDDGMVVTLLVALNTDYFVNHFTRQLASDRGTVEILRYDGIVLMTTSPSLALGQSRAGLLGELGVPDAESRQLQRTDETGRPSLLAFKSSNLYPVVVVSHLTRDRVLAAWRTEVRTLLMVLLPALLAVVVLSVAFYRRRMQIAAMLAVAQDQERIHATVYRASTDAIVITDQDANVLSVNPAFTRIVGFEQHEVLGRNPRLWASGRHGPEVYQRMWHALMSEGIWKGELINRRRDGSLFDAEVSITVSPDGEGRFRHFIGYLSDITQRKLAEAALRSSEERFRDLTHLSSDWYWEQDQDFRFVRVEGELEALSGITSQSHIGKARWELPALNMNAQDWAQHRALLDAHQPFYNLEMRRPDHNGRLHWVSISGTPVFDPQGRFTGYRGVGSDITDRKLAEENLKLAASVFTHSHEAILITAADGSILNINEAFTRITGFERDEVRGRNPRLLKSGLQDDEFYADLWHNLIEKGHWTGEIWNRRKDGAVYAAMQTISAVRDAQGAITQFVGLFADITTVKQHELQLERIAHYDALTALPNRMLLADRLQQGMAMARRSGRTLAVAFLDLDGFKAINDGHGHTAGDQLLVALASRMRETLRDVDTLARIGGDEFVAVLVDQPSPSDSLPVLDRLLEASAQPVAVGEAMFKVSASLGVTFYPQAAEVDADQLLRQADQAMYQAKLAGKNRYHVFDEHLDRHARGQLESLDRTRRALRSKEMLLYFQPKVNLRTREVIGVEALIRWQHPDRGILLPQAFLPATNGHALGIEIGEWVIEQALQQLVAWGSVGLDLPISVNISGHQLQQPAFMARLEAALARHPSASPQRLQMEVLESSALDDLEQVTHVIRACRALGVSFALDDFGTGYSTLAYLKRLPVSQLKIDQTFVSGMVIDIDDLAILEGVLALARAFRHDAIAEGVESAEHCELLLRLGCELAQGNHIAAPMTASDLVEWFRSWPTTARWRNLSALAPDRMPLLLSSVDLRAHVYALLRHPVRSAGLTGEMFSLQAWLEVWLADTHQKLVRLAQPVEPIEMQGQCLVRQLAQMIEDRDLPDPSVIDSGLAELRKGRDRLLDALDAAMDGELAH